MPTASTTTRSASSARSATTPSTTAARCELLERGQVDPDAIITHTFPLEQVDEAFRTVAAGEALKVMVDDRARERAQDEP